VLQEYRKTSSKDCPWNCLPLSVLPCGTFPHTSWVRPFVTCCHIVQNFTTCVSSVQTLNHKDMKTVFFCDHMAANPYMYTWSRQSAEVQTKHQNGEDRWFKWLWTWHGCWYQTGESEYFRNYWDFHAQSSLGEWSKEREHIQWAAVLWVKTPCWCQRSE